MKDLLDLDVRGPREPPDWAPSGVYPNLAKARAYLDALRVHHFALSRRFLSVDEDNLHLTDMLVVSVAARSYSLVDGFLWAFDTWNPVVAAPVVRMQIDNIVRVSYASRHENTDELAKYMLGGGELRGRKDADGHRLTDRRLVELASEHHPWIPDVYVATSAWVHLSPELVHSVFAIEEDDDGDEPSRTIGFSIPIARKRIPEEALQEWLDVMTRATEDLFGYFEAWESRKGLPLGEMRDISVAGDEARATHSQTHTQSPENSD